MDVRDRAEQESEPISVERCRELLDDDANAVSDEEVLIIARHAEWLALKPSRITCTVLGGLPLRP